MNDHEDPASDPLLQRLLAHGARARRLTMYTLDAWADAVAADATGDAARPQATIGRRLAAASAPSAFPATYVADGWMIVLHAGPTGVEALLAAGASGASVLTATGPVPLELDGWTPLAGVSAPPESLRVRAVDGSVVVLQPDP
jgi:hypothetical protein